jgi:hypothetical protein
VTIHTELDLMPVDWGLVQLAKLQLGGELDIHVTQKQQWLAAMT